MITTVEKRDGRVVGYNEEKIKAAIRKAMLQTEKGEDENTQAQTPQGGSAFEDLNKDFGSSEYTGMKS